MEEKWNSRTEILIGTEKIKKLENANIIVYGIGGVGSYAVEGVVRAGIGKITLVDNDIISTSNLNRQIHATINTVGKSKVEVMKERILSINPKAEVKIYMPKRLKETEKIEKLNNEKNLKNTMENLEENSEENLINRNYSYVIDAVDTITTKLKLVEKANELNIPIISALGAGNKLDPCAFQVSDIYKTKICPLARIMRKELKKIGINKLKVVYSQEEAKSEKIVVDENNKRVIGSISFVPSVAGLIIAGEVIKDLLK